MVSLFVVPVHSAHGQRGSSPFESQSGSVRGQKIDWFCLPTMWCWGLAWRMRKLKLLATSARRWWRCCLIPTKNASLTMTSLVLMPVLILLRARLSSTDCGSSVPRTTLWIVVWSVLGLPTCGFVSADCIWMLLVASFSFSFLTARSPEQCETDCGLHELIFFNRGACIHIHKYVMC